MELKKIQTVGNLIRWGRLRTHIPPIILARKLNITIDEYMQIESNTSCPSDYQLKVLIKELHLDKNKVSLLTGKMV